MPTDLITSDRFLLHETYGHPERPERLRAIQERLRQAKLLEGRAVLEPEPASVETLALIHDRAYIAEIEAFARAGGGWLDPDTYVCRESYEVALLAVGAAVQAVDRVGDGQSRRVFALVRPPGHHAEPRRAMGFCLFNNIAVAAQYALVCRGLSRVAILDWDVHHGNGTQTAFYETDTVLFISLHQWPLYPGTGRGDEIGRGRGFGYTLNLPLRPGTGDEGYRELFDQVIGPRLAQYRPELLLVSAGFDAHRLDPLASMDVTEFGFAGMAVRARRWADELCGGRLALVLEGGYNLTALAASVEATLRALDDPGPDGSPE